jgi:hypothetical protein
VSLSLDKFFSLSSSFDELSSSLYFPWLLLLLLLLLLLNSFIVLFVTLPVVCATVIVLRLVDEVGGAEKGNSESICLSIS